MSLGHRRLYLTESSVSALMAYSLDAEELQFDCCQGQEIIFSPTASRPASGPTQHLEGGRSLGHEADQ
jgi:hypothetical protein